MREASRFQGANGGVHTLGTTSVVPSLAPPSAIGQSLELSIVVTAFAGAGELDRMLLVLDEVDAAGVEVIVACDVRVGDPGTLRARHPRVEFLHHPVPRTPAQLRAAGVGRARGRVVAITEDHCVPTPDWCDAIIAEHAGSAAAIGGAMDKGHPATGADAALDWALYLADFSRYMRPFAAAEASSASDCNVSYKRVALDAVSASWQGEFHENVVHAALRALGYTLARSPRIVVHEHRSLTWRAALQDRYRFGRLFGATRLGRAPAARRWMLAAGALLLPPLLYLRVARTVLTRRRYRLAFVRATPSLAVLLATWATGELLGYLTGTTDPSLAATAPPAPVREPA